MAGLCTPNGLSPEGTAETPACRRSAVPTGLCAVMIAHPSDKSLGFCHDVPPGHGGSRSAGFQPASINSAKRPLIRCTPSQTSQTCLTVSRWMEGRPVSIANGCKIHKSVSLCLTARRRCIGGSMVFQRQRARVWGMGKMPMLRLRSVEKGRIHCNRLQNSQKCLTLSHGRARPAFPRTQR